MIVEPALGQEEKYAELMDQLSRPMEGTSASKKKAQSDALAQFGLDFETVNRMMAKRKAEKAEKGE